MLLVHLGGGVDVARVERRGSVTATGVSSPRARRATRLEPRPPRGRRGSRGAGATRAVIGAPVAALPVDDHAAGQDQPAAEARRGERAQQHRGAEVVVADVLGRCRACPTPEPDHRRLVADGVDSAQRRADDVGDRATSPVDELGVGVEVVRRGGVRRRQQQVQHAHSVARVHERVDDVRADEPGASGDENHRAARYGDRAHRQRRATALFRAA